MIEMIVSAKVVYLMSGNLDTLMLRETRDLAMLLPMLLPMHSSLLVLSSRLQQAPAYSLTWPGAWPLPMLGMPDLNRIGLQNKARVSNPLYSILPHSICVGVCVFMCLLPQLENIACTPLYYPFSTFCEFREFCEYEATYLHPFCSSR